MSDLAIILRFYRLKWAQVGLDLIYRNPRAAKLAFLAGTAARDLETL